VNLKLRSIRTTIAILVPIVAIAVVTDSMRPSPRASIEQHWRVFATHGLLATLLFALAGCLIPARLRAVYAVTSVAVIIGAALAHPVCVLIPAIDRPSYETVISLSDRAARGEPFVRFAGEWYQCKSFLARAFFF
jgi:hypothetical protein